MHDTAENSCGARDPAGFLVAQRGLRDRLLSGGLRAHRELAAEMLLYLDEPQRCWQACADWLMTATRAERVDAGFAAAADACYRPAFESVRDDVALPRVLGLAMNAREPGIRAVWAASSVIVYDDIRDDARLSPALRQTLLAAGTRRKLAVALRDAGRDVGLLCVDSSSAALPWQAGECLRLDQAAREVIAPILATLRHLAREGSGRRSTTAANQDFEARMLTPAEYRVARLVLAGCSYKEIARRLERSASTIDHQLRSIRAKLGVNSNARLMRSLLALAPPPAQAPADSG